MIFEDHHGGKERPTFSRSQYIESIFFIEDAKIKIKLEKGRIIYLIVPGR